MIFIRYPTVWIYSTGDELKSNEDKHHSCIRDTNSLMIKQLLEQDNYEGSVFIGGVIRDKCVIFNMIYIFWYWSNYTENLVGMIFANNLRKHLTMLIL